MKMFAVLSVATAATSAIICAQPGDGCQGPPRDSFFQLFDTDENGEISQQEIDAASAILSSRDSDGSGSLTPDELPRPPRPPRRGDDDDRRDDGRRKDGRRIDRSENLRGHRPGSPPPRNERRGNERDANPTRQRPQFNEESEAVNGTVMFRGGHQTNPIDKGRPVALIAAALGVEEQVFRDAFSNVRPSSFGPPSAARAQANKKVLMDALGPHGITNDRLDEVSNYYRYRPDANELWTVTPASAKAIIKDGQVSGFVMIDAGSGYSSPPTVSIAGYPDVRVKATIEFGKNLRTNGRVAKLTIVRD